MDIVFLVLMWIIIIIGILLGIFTLFLTIIQFKQNSKLSLIISIQLSITSVLALFASLTYLYESYFFVFLLTFCSILGDLGKLTIAIIIILLGQLNFVNPDEHKTKIFVFISIIIGFILPLSISTTASLLGVFWVKDPIFYPLIVSLRYILIIAFFVLSFIIVNQMNKIYEKEEGDKEYYKVFMKKICIYRCVIGYHCVALIALFIRDRIDMEKENIIYGVIELLYCSISLIYLIGFMLNKNKLKEFFYLLTCNKELNYVQLREDAILELEN